MDKALRNILRNTVVRCRRLLEEEIGEILQGQFGIHASGEIEEAGHLTHLLADDATYREQVLIQLAHLRSSGAGAAEAVAQLVRETAFTHLNRLCAFKMMEQRKLIRTAVTNGLNSNGFKFYLADHPEDERLWSEGRQDLAYRHFLEWLSAKHTDEIRALFAPTDPANRLFPKQAVLDQVLALLNSEELGEVWSEDETIGWIYQYFTPKELRDQAHKESSAPRNSYELAFRNQFYTPRYVVEFLVDNTLGRTWYEMRQGQTILAESCRYLLGGPGESIPVREKKDPREIRVLDPACGSGHFLLYCFDLFLTIYEEAYADPDLGPRLRTEYPTLTDLRRAAPGLILAHNLHGIDIDPRATQIAALALWLRAQRAYREWGFGPDERGKITKSNLVCAEPMPGDREMLNEFVAGLKPPVLGQLVESVFDRMGRLAGEAGSLLTIEAEIGDAIHRARRQWLGRPRHEQLALLAAEPVRRCGEQLEFDLSGITDEEFWCEAEERVVESLREYARRATNGRGFARQLFADDAAQGLAFVDLCRKQFDVVLMNPPFGEATPSACEYLGRTYEFWNGNLLCAFIMRGWDMLTPSGLLGTIFDRTAFVKSTYESFRRSVLIPDPRLTLVADLGWEVLDANVEVTTCVLRHGSEHPAIFLDVRGEDPRDKGVRIERAVTNIASGMSDPCVRAASPMSFQELPNAVIGYDFPEFLRAAFQEADSLETRGFRAYQGHALKADKHFRLWWELKQHSRGGFKARLFNGAGFTPYLTVLRDCVVAPCELENLPGDTATVLRNRDKQTLPGVCFGKRGDFFAAHVLPRGCIFTVEGQSIPVDDPAKALELLGFLNTPLARFSLNKYCGQHKYSGYVNLLPYRGFSDTDGVRTAVRNAIEAAFNAQRFDETQSMFTILPWGESIAKFGKEMSYAIQASRAAAEHCESFCHNQTLVAYNVSEEDIRVLESFRQTQPCLQSPIEDADVADDCRWLAAHSMLSQSIGFTFGLWDVRFAVGELPLPSIPDAFDPLPFSSPGMFTSEDGLSVEPRPEGYPLAINIDGILVDDPENPDDIMRKVRYVLELVFGVRAEAIEREACEILGVKELRDYFRNPQGFLAEHIKRYSKSRRKAPIYWLLQSPRKSYGLWLYYHRLDKDILFKALTLYVEPKIQLEENRLAAFREELRACLGSGRPARPAEKVIERQELLLSDLQDFRERLERAAKLYLEPDLDDGVLLNIAPLYELVPWKEAKAIWNELVAGKYEWSSIGRQLRSKKLVKV